MPPARLSRIYVIAGVNGAGKSSIGGAAFRAFGGDYYNPDEAARQLIDVGETRPDPSLNPSELAAWTMVANLMLNLDEVINRG